MMATCKPVPAKSVTSIDANPVKPAPTQAIVDSSSPIDISEPDPAAPVITDVNFSETIQSGVAFGEGSVNFSDRDGDIHSAQFTLVEGGCMEFEYFAFDPMDAIQEGDLFSGEFQFRQACVKCADSESDVILMQVQLFDRQAHASEPAIYQFICR